MCACTCVGRFGARSRYASPHHRGGDQPGAAAGADRHSGRETGHCRDRTEKSRYVRMNPCMHQSCLLPCLMVEIAVLMLWMSSYVYAYTPMHTHLCMFMHAYVCMFMHALPVFMCYMDLCVYGCVTSSSSFTCIHERTPTIMRQNWRRCPPSCARPRGGTTRSSALTGTRRGRWVSTRTHTRCVYICTYIPGTYMCINIYVRGAWVF
jgi:hypothetical protein